MELSTRSIIVLVWSLRALVFTTLVIAQWLPHARGADLRNGFESPQPTWQAGESDARHRTLSHRRLHGDSHSGEWCEDIQVEAGNGTFIHFQHEIGQAVVMEGVVPSVWLKANRPGARLTVRAVLPKALDPQTGQPGTVLLYGDGYEHVGGWQRLEVRDVEKLLVRQQRVLRQKYQRDVSIEDAFLDRAVLNIFGGEGLNNVRIDDLEVRQYVDYRELSRQLTPTDPKARSITSTVGNERKVKLERRGSVVYVDRVPFAPRVLDHQGESFPLVRRLGFNTVRLREPPTAEQLADARRNQLLLICPADSPAGEDNDASQASYASAPILAWEVSPATTAAGNEGAARLASLGTPKSWPTDGLTVGLDADFTSSYPRPDFAIIGNSEPDFGASWSGQARWHDSLMSRVSQPSRGWSRIASEYPRSFLDQLRAFGVPPGSLPGPTSDDLRMRIRWALANGSRGIVIDSTTPFAEDVANSYRSAAVEQANLDLQMVHPWMSSGRVSITLSTAWPWLKAAVMEVQHAKLLVFLLADDPPLEGAIGRPSLVVPGIPESSRAYVLTPAGFEPVLNQTRVAGGTRLELPQGDPLQFVVLAHHPHIVAGLDAFLRTSRARAAQLERRLLADSWAAIQRAASQAPNGIAIQELVQQAAARTQECDTFLTAGQVFQAYQSARQGSQILETARHVLLNQAVLATGPRVSIPLAEAVESLPAHFQWVQQLNRFPLGQNLLLGGDCEDLDAMRQAGWRHFHEEGSQTPSGAELPIDAPHGGRRSLRLDARATGSMPGGFLMKTPPTWIVSPTIPVRSGDLIVIEGWARIPQPLESTVDGLLIFDSLGGEPLALRLRHTEGWQRFMLVRRAGGDTNLAVTLALNGIGEAYVDDVSIRVARMGTRAF